MILNIYLTIFHSHYNLSNRKFLIVNYSNLLKFFFFFYYHPSINFIQKFIINKIILTSFIHNADFMQHPETITFVRPFFCQFNSVFHHIRRKIFIH